MEGSFGTEALLEQVIEDY